MTFNQRPPPAPRADVSAWISDTVAAMVEASDRTAAAVSVMASTSVSYDVRVIVKVILCGRHGAS